MHDPIYFLECDHGKAGRDFTGDREWTRRNVADFVVSSEKGKVVKVLEAREDEHRLTDITEDIARDIADRFYADREPVPYELQNFLHSHLGVTSTRNLVLAA
jgi:hypothetical protein